MALGFDTDDLYERRLRREAPPPEPKKVLKGQAALSSFVRLLENRKLHYRTKFQDIPISVENRKGSIRRGKDPDGNDWATKHKRPYGYIPGTRGVDGDELDVFVGPDKDAAYAYVIHINDPKSGEYDEDKVMLGFSTQEAAVKCFRDHYDEPHKFFDGVDAIPMWKLSKKVFTKKYTSQRLVASRRRKKRTKETWGFSSKSLVHDTSGKNHGGAAHIFT